MANYTNNEDKRGCKETGLYNNVLKVELGTGTEPVDTNELKAWGKIEQDEDDDIITALGIAARQVCEQFSGLGFFSRTVTARIENANGGFGLPYGPVTNTPTATDVDGNSVTLTYNLGQIQEPFGKLIVSYTGGYATLPENLKTALKAQFLYMYENRGESNTGISPVAEMILKPLRVVV